MYAPYAERETTTARILRRQNPIIRGTLVCRICSRQAAELLGYRNRSLTEARFFPNRAAPTPRRHGSTLRCGHCGGSLYLDDVEELAPSVRLSEVGGSSLYDLLAGRAAVPPLRIRPDLPPEFADLSA